MQNVPLPRLSYIYWLIHFNIIINKLTERKKLPCAKTCHLKELRNAKFCNIIILKLTGKVCKNRHKILDKIAYFMDHKNKGLGEICKLFKRK